MTNNSAQLIFQCVRHASTRCDRAITQLQSYHHITVLHYYQFVLEISSATATTGQQYGTTDMAAMSPISSTYSINSDLVFQPDSSTQQLTTVATHAWANNIKTALTQVKTT